ncbi:outer membrane transport energization protein TonB [Desulfacinum infernum DSM 9756]|uniref:Outer membrane transport energization protein TonB n=1 Tax=Desulfacinum infernum DSM 9756 TaxID=1121391 RepID=A0A1M4ZIX6_9BACT|nr:energy transducer TonB [Desulfacinum infernum]SHF17925.1 outer membrane transport energization protein TonB [Desulfacinum infernum DSM 9756]
MKPQRMGTERGGERAAEGGRSRINRLLWSFLAVSLLVHGWALAVVSRHLQREPLQIIELEWTAPAEPKVEPGPPPMGVRRQEPVRPLPVPEVQPAVARVPEPPEPPKPIRTVESLRPTVVPEVAPRPRPQVNRRTVPMEVPDPKPAAREVETAPLVASTNPAPRVAAGDPQGVPSEAVRGNPGDALQRFLAEVRRRIARHKHYPAAARRRQLEGRVTVRFAIRPDGSADGLKVVESSGVSVLDRAALEAVRRAAPFPGFPRQVSDRALEVEIGVVFELT